MTGAVARPTFFPAPAVPRTAPLGTREHPLPLIIDSDPGLDDALAIGLAVALPEIDLLAVTTVGGNADVRHCTTNALRLLNVYGAADVPVAEGAPGALVGAIVTGSGCTRRIRAITSTACSATAAAGEGGSTVLPMPASPWIAVARTIAPTRAPGDPSATGTSNAP